MVFDVAFIGSIIILFNFIFQRLGYIDPKGLFYDATNTIGSAFCLYSALRMKNFGFLIMESFWFAFGVIATSYNLFLLYKKKTKI